LIVREETLKSIPPFNLTRTIFITERDIIDLKFRKDTIMPYIPERYRDEADKLINAIISNEEKMRNISKDPVITEYLQTMFESYIKNENVEIYENDKPAKPKNINKNPEYINTLLLKTAEYEPVPVIYEENGKLHEGYLYIPTKEDLSKIKRMILDERLFERMLEEIIVAGIDTKKASITIGNRTYKFDDESFVNILTKFALDEIARGYLSEKVREVTNDIKQEAETNITEIVKNLEKYKDTHISVEFDIHNWIFPAVFMNFKILNERMNITVTKMLNTKNLKEDAIKSIQQVKQRIINIIPHIETFFDIATKKGYQIEVGKTSLTFSESMRQVYWLRKNNTTLFINLFEDGNVEVEYSYKYNTSEIKKKIPIEQLEKQIEEHIYKTLNTKPTIRYDRDTKTIEISALLKTNINDLSNVLDKLESINNIEIKPDRKTIPEELIVASYLIKFVDEYYPNTVLNITDGEIVTGIKKIVKKIDPELYEDIRKGRIYGILHSVHILRALAEKRYISLTPEGDIVIKGKTLKEILQSTGNTTPTEINSINRGVFNVLFTWIFEGRKLTYEEIKDIIPITPTTVSMLMERYVVHPSLLAAEYNGKPIWEQLDKSLKEEYIFRVLIDSEKLYDILTKYNELFPDIVNEGIQRLVEIDPQLGTKYLALYRPELITKQEVIPYKDGDFFGILKNNFAVEVLKITSLNPDSEKIFAVYRIDKRIGIPIKARTVEEAVSKIQPIYDNIIKEIENLRKLDKKIIIKKTNYLSGWKRLESILTEYGEYPITYEAINKLKKHLSRKEQRREDENNLVSA